MKRRRLFISVILILVWLSAFIAASLTSAAPQERPEGKVECAKRATELAPPRELMPTLRALGGREEQIEPARKLKPVCPEGEVPVVHVAPGGRRFRKGNPLIGPYAQPEPERPLSGEFIRRNLLRPFDQVYWKRDGNRQGAPPKPMNGSGDAPCNGVAWFGSCYYYANAAETRSADGGGMTFTIEAPVVDNSGDDGGHSIGEIAVQGGPDNGDDVEMGWSSSPDQFGDTNPHLFVFHFINWDQRASALRLESVQQHLLPRHGFEFARRSKLVHRLGPL
jgi:hypothetical protein